MAVSGLPKICEDALGYASLGIPVFPCFGINPTTLKCRCGEDECKSPGKHPKTTNGLNSASTDPIYIKLSWEHEKWGNNLAGVSGEMFWVLDVDKKSGGLDTLAEWEAEHGKLDAAWIQRTGGGGLQYFFTGHPDIRNSNAKIGKGMDVRGHGGYVMLPPSLHESGKNYTWHKDKRPHVKELFPAPEWLLEKVLASTPKERFEIPEAIPEGQRNDTVFRFACSLRAQGIEFEPALTQCLFAASRAKPPLPESETRTIVEGVYGRYESGPARFGIEVRSDDEKKDFPFTDLGNAERLIWRLDGNVRFCHAYQKWLIWDGVRWRIDETGGAVMLQEAARMVREMGESKLEARSKLSNMLDLAQKLSGVSVTPDELDRNPRLLGVANGTLNLVTGELQAPNKDELITMSSPVEFRSGVECPTFERFVEDVCLGDNILVAYIQAAMGYTLTGLTNEHCLFFCYGDGANGKSTLLDVLSHLLGDYSRSIPAEIFSSVNSMAQMESSIARLKGARLVRCSETNNKRVAESMLKEFVDGSPMEARHKYGHPFEFRPIAKLWISGNSKPHLTGQDWGIWRRIRLLPFLLKVEDAKQDKSLKDKLIAESSGILNWALDGLLWYWKHGLPECELVTEHTDEYRAEMDTIGNFIEECCDVTPNFRIASSALYSAYSKWCKFSGHFALSQTKFGLEIKKRGFMKDRSEVGIYISGIDLTDDVRASAGRYWE